MKKRLLREFKEMIMLFPQWPIALKICLALCIAILIVDIAGYDDMPFYIGLVLLAIYIPWWCAEWKANKRSDRFLDAKDHKELCLGIDWQYGCEYYYEERGVGLCGQPEAAEFCIPD